MVVETDSASLRHWMSRARGVPVNLSASRALACIYSVTNSSHVQLEGLDFARRGGEGLEDDSIRVDPTAEYEKDISQSSQSRSDGGRRIVNADVFRQGLTT